MDTKFGPHLPREYIKIIPHPHSPDPTTRIITLNNSESKSASQLASPVYIPQPELHPWAPFENLADFEYTETAIKGLLPKWIVDKQLAGINSSWADGSRLTIKSFAAMDERLTRARKHFVQVSINYSIAYGLAYGGPCNGTLLVTLISSNFHQFKHDVVTATYQGKGYDFAFEFRDPWEWILSVIQDESLASMCMWNAVRKSYCSGDFEERIYDEPNTANTWWDVDVSSGVLISLQPAHYMRFSLLSSIV